MFDFFYNFYKKPLGFNLYTRENEDGTPAPPESQLITSQAGEDLTSQTDEDLISNS
jgi:hypothetical protein